MKRNNRIIQYGWNLFLASRVFPYGRFLITLFPFYAILMHSTSNISLWSLTLILPYVFAFSAGFMYNTICDSGTDPKDKNPITRGDLSMKIATVEMRILIAFSIALLFIFYKNWIAWITFLIYLFLWLSYSGLRIRFKESLAGPVAASIVLWIGPSLIVLIEFNFFETSAMTLLLGLFFIFIAYEIEHTIIDYELDALYGSKTFSIKLGKRNATITKYCMLIAGFIFLMYATEFLIGDEAILFRAIFAILFLLSIIFNIYNWHQIGYTEPKYISLSPLPYILTRIFIIAYGLLLLQIPTILIIFVIWIFFIRKYP